MKKLLFLLILFPFVLNSCGSDDDKNDDDLKDKIIGTWVLQSIVPFEVETNNANITEKIKEDLTENDTTGRLRTITFLASGKLIVIDEREGNTFGSYTLKGNVLNVDGEAITVSVSGNTLYLIYDETDTYVEEYGDKANVVKVTSKYTLKRK